MNLSRFPRILRLSSALGMLAVWVCLPCRGAPAESKIEVKPGTTLILDRLIIADGVMPEFIQDGRPPVATLGNVLKVFRSHFTVDYSVTLLGSDVGQKIVIPDLVLHWGRPDEGSSLVADLSILAEATDGKFSVKAYSPRDILIRAEPTGRTNHAEVEAFNLAAYLGLNEPEALMPQLNALKQQYLILSAEYAENHPKMKTLQDKIHAIETAIADKRPSAEQIQRKVQGISDLVNETLASVSPSIPRPKSYFHPGTNLLVIVGTPDAIDAARKIIAALSGNQ